MEKKTALQQLRKTLGNPENRKRLVDALVEKNHKRLEEQRADALVALKKIARILKKSSK